MTSSTLFRAAICYGRYSNEYLVERGALHPLPAEFDFAQPAECARLILAVMSNAAGGHTLRDCRVFYSMERRTACVSASGAYARYSPAFRPPMTVEEATRIVHESVTIQLGSVTTDQYGEGWKRARWNEPPVVSQTATTTGGTHA
jgi:hypothetical protein